ncbi:MAG: (deoxy)nucleoside triphosphate pyrophosphohydrolase [Bryobacterales bacterium]|nr:(deoxy)nucleoside triphosphate pyrophosphohydrolase [Bryobacterales bacterium]
MTTVVAGILEQHGAILACRRRSDQAHPGKWEFPGGKVEPGESPEQALRRELCEELHIEAQIGREIERYQFAYPGKNPILLIFLAVEGWSGDLDRSFFAETVWRDAAALADLDFLEGDLPFLERLQTRPRKLFSNP